jgi:CRP-like cAMP-binding protein
LTGEANGKIEFDPELHLKSAQVAKQRAHFLKGQTVFSQGEFCTSVFYIEYGVAKLSSINEDGNEAVVAILEAGDFLGEACLSKASAERATRAVALEPTSVLVIQKKEMLRILREEQEFGNYFISYLLRRNMRIEANLVDQLKFK